MKQSTQTLTISWGLAVLGLLAAVALSACPSDSEETNNGSSNAETPTSAANNQPPPPTNNGTTPTPTGNNGTTPTSTANNNTMTGNNGSTMTTVDMPCTDVTVFSDADGDGFAPQGADSKMVCLRSGESEAGYAREQGDCNDGDPIQFPMSEGVCLDYVDDNCDGDDEVCPTTMRADQINDPLWDCTGTPPDQVYAWAKLGPADDYFRPGGCFVFFEGFKDMFYATHNVEFARDCGNSVYGCICPESGRPGGPTYDDRMYVHTRTALDDAECDNLRLDDVKGKDNVPGRWKTQPVSNSCQKYLFALNMEPGPQGPLTYVTSSVDALKARLDNFPVVHIACLEVFLGREQNDGSVMEVDLNIPHSDLASAEIEFNPNFKKTTR